MKIARLLILTVPMLVLWIVGVLIAFGADMTGWECLDRANDRLAQWFEEIEAAL